MSNNQASRASIIRRYLEEAAAEFAEARRTHQESAVTLDEHRRRLDETLLRFRDEVVAQE